MWIAIITFIYSVGFSAIENMLKKVRQKETNWIMHSSFKTTIKYEDRPL